MKKIFAGCLSLIVLLSMAGCSNHHPASKQAEPNKTSVKRKSSNEKTKVKKKKIVKQQHTKSSSSQQSVNTSPTHSLQSKINSQSALNKSVSKVLLSLIKLKIKIVKVVLNYHLQILYQIL